MQLVTLATPATLPRARVLARSLERHQPDWPLDVVLIGREEVVAQAADGESALHLRSASALLELDTERLIARHDESDLVVLLLPRLLQSYAEKLSAPVFHLPSSAWVLGGLEPIESALAQRGVLLVPRITADVPDDGLEPSREHLERAGRIAAGTMGVDGGDGAGEFLAWWAQRVEKALGSLDGRKTGDRPEDRPWLARYLELAPARFSTAVLDDPGCNLSMWNLHERELRASADGVLLDGRLQLRFLDLPGFEPERPHRLAALASRARVSRSPVLRALCIDYAAELQRAGWQDVGRRRDVGRPLNDGLHYDDSMRMLYTRALSLGERFGDLFSEEGASTFIAWLEGPAPEGAGHGITRYVFYRVANERPDVMRSYPDLDGADGAEYVRWCWAYGRDELSIPDRFMPRPGGCPPARAVPLVEPTASTGPAASDEASTSGRGSAAGGGSAREHPAADDGLAVRVTGYLSHALGLGAAARGYARALAAVDVPVSTVSVPLHHLALPVALADGYGRHSFEDLVHDGLHGFELVAVNADELPDFVERLGEDYFEGPRIGIWGWETNRVPPGWRRAYALIDEIWVYSRFMAENIGAVAPVPVIALPPPVQAPAEPAEPLRLGVPEGFLFLFVFDYLSTIQRKNPVGLIEAFKRAFAPGEGPRLLIKTINAPLRPLAEEEVLWAAHGRPDIHVIDRSLSGAELNGVMAACDCYVSLHRSEGFGLTMAEAMAIGKPVIGTGYSGNVDFMSDENSYLVDYTIARVGPECEIYPADGEWAQPDLEHAAQLMRRVCSEPEQAAAIGARAREDIARTLSPQARGAAMRERLQELLSRGAGSALAGAAAGRITSSHS